LSSEDVFGEKVTIGLCTKNSEKTISRCIESIINQDYPKSLMEIFVVDGLSNDCTLKIADELVSKSRISATFLSDGGKGIASARQIVLKRTRNKYVVFVDSDAILSPCFVNSQVEFMKKNLHLGVALGKFEYRKDIQTALPAILQGLSKYVETIEWINRKMPTGFPANDASTYLVEVAIQVGGFDENIEGASEDEDLILRLKNRGWTISVDEKATFYAFSRESWQSLWKENTWFGYGKHFLSHKHKVENFFWRNFPFFTAYSGLRQGILCYKLTRSKFSFLLPMLAFFNSTSLCYGFVRAHQEGYGHRKN
jgi:glycosyltransferase involved in cell wall biosynthesis